MSVMDDWPLAVRVLAYLGIAAATHLVVLLLRRAAARLVHGAQDRKHRKLRSLATLVTSAAVFALYFYVFGLILQAFTGLTLTTYFASASVIALAVGFGSQGIVQDVVTGLTLIFSDLIDVGDLVETSGQTGVVRSISMRFVEIENSIGASVFIPNRTIGSVINYPRGYIRCLVDVTLTGDALQKQRMEEIAGRLMRAFAEQFPAILRTDPSVEGRYRLASGKELCRLKFRIWPNRGGPIETVFVQELVATLKRENENYQPWMVAVTYEVEARQPLRSVPAFPWRLPGRRGQDTAKRSEAAHRDADALDQDAARRDPPIGAGSSNRD